MKGFLQHSKTGAAADVGAERAMYSGLPMTPQREQAAAQRGVAAGAMSNGDMTRGEAAQFRFGGLDVVGHHRARASETEALVDREIVRRPRKAATHLGDFVEVLVKMCLDAQ